MNKHLPSAAVECPYCLTTHGLRIASQDPWGGNVEYICEECFTGQDDGPCFDDLEPVARLTLTPQEAAMSHVSHYSPNTWGNFTAVGSRGQRYGLIGHYSEDVTKWLAANPEFNGTIYFDYGNDEPQVDVTEVFFPEADEAIELVEAA